MAAEFVHCLEGVSALGHRPLAQHFTGDEKIRAKAGQQFRRLREHQAVAVDAGIVVLAEAVDGVLQHLQMGGGNVDNGDLHAVGPRAFDCPVCRDVGCGEADGMHLVSHFLHPGNGQDAVQASGEEGEGRFFAHGILFHQKGPAVKSRPIGLFDSKARLFVHVRLDLVHKAERVALGLVGGLELVLAPIIVVVGNAGDEDLVLVHHLVTDGIDAERELFDGLDLAPVGLIQGEGLFRAGNLADDSHYRFRAVSAGFDYMEFGIG